MLSGEPWADLEDEDDADEWWQQWSAESWARMEAECAEVREQSMREDRAQRYESDWQRRVVFEADGNTMKVEIGQACWSKEIMGRLLRSLGPWEKGVWHRERPHQPGGQSV